MEYVSEFEIEKLVLPIFFFVFNSYFLIYLILKSLCYTYFLTFILKKISVLVELLKMFCC